jgi:hypothetical protein
LVELFFAGIEESPQDNDMLGPSDAATSVPARLERFVFFMTLPPETRDHPGTCCFKLMQPGFTPAFRSLRGLAGTFLYAGVSKTSLVIAPL